MNLSKHWLTQDLSVTLDKLGNHLHFDNENNTTQAAVSSGLSLLDSHQLLHNKLYSVAVIIFINI